MGLWIKRKGATRYAVLSHPVVQVLFLPAIALAQARRAGMMVESGRALSSTCFGIWQHPLMKGYLTDLFNGFYLTFSKITNRMLENFGFQFLHKHISNIQYYVRFCHNSFMIT